MKLELLAVAGFAGMSLLASPAAAQAVHATAWGWYGNADFGHAVAPVGDIDGDGYQDYLVGAPQSTGGTGAAQGGGFLVSGRHQNVIRAHHSGHAGSRGGWSVAGGFDLDGDGCPDYAIGYPWATVNGQANAGFVVVHSGKSGGVLYTLSGILAGSLFGESIAFIGDADGDWVCDIAIGMPQQLVYGSVRIFSGATGAYVSHSTPPETTVSSYGSNVVGVGDWNGDGRADYAVSGTLNGAYGLVRVISGLNGALLFEFKTTVSLSGFGSAVVSIPDIDGDKRRDLVIAAPGENQRGVVRLFGTVSKQALVTVEGQHTGGRFGEGLASVGDIDGDGRGDVVVTSGAGSEALRVISSITGQTIGTPIAKIAGTSAGASVAPVGDLDADGWLDVVMGEPKAVAGPNALGATRVVRLAHHQANLGYHSTGAHLSIHGHVLSSTGWADLRVSQAEPNIGGVLIVSPWMSPVPFGAGTLVPTLDGILLPFVTDANGVYTIKGIPGGLGQFSLYCQAALKTAEPTPAIRFTNVVRADFLP